MLYPTIDYLRLVLIVLKFIMYQVFSLPGHGPGDHSRQQFAWRSDQGSCTEVD